MQRAAAEQMDEYAERRNFCGLLSWDWLIDLHFKFNSEM